MSGKNMKPLPDSMFRENVSGDKTYLKWGMVVLASVALIIAIGVIIYSMIKPDAPDPKTADIKTLVDFTKTDAFLEMNSKDRSKYLKDMTQNFDSLDHDKRAEMKQYLDDLRQKDRKGHTTVMLGIAAGMSEQMDGMSEDQQRAHVQNMIKAAEMMRGGRDNAQAEYDRRFHSDGTAHNHERLMKEMVRDRDLVLKTTTAVQRAKMMRTARMMLQEAHSRYGE